MREFNVEFERMVLRLREVQCELPPLVKAWLYVDKLRLSENEELALLASVWERVRRQKAPAGSNDTRSFSSSWCWRARWSVEAQMAEVQQAECPHDHQ